MVPSAQVSLTRREALESEVSREESQLETAWLARVRAFLRFLIQSPLTEYSILKRLPQDKRRTVECSQLCSVWRAIRIQNLADGQYLCLGSARGLQAALNRSIHENYVLQQDPVALAWDHPRHHCSSQTCSRDCHRHYLRMDPQLRPWL